MTSTIVSSMPASSMSYQPSNYSSNRNTMFNYPQSVQGPQDAASYYTQNTASTYQSNGTYQSNQVLSTPSSNAQSNIMYNYPQNLSQNNDISSYHTSNTGTTTASEDIERISNRYLPQTPSVHNSTKNKSQAVYSTHETKKSNSDDESQFQVLKTEYIDYTPNNYNISPPCQPCQPCQTYAQPQPCQQQVYAQPQPQPQQQIYAQPQQEQPQTYVQPQSQYQQVQPQPQYQQVQPQPEYISPLQNLQQQPIYAPPQVQAQMQQMEIANNNFQQEPMEMPRFEFVDDNGNPMGPSQEMGLPMAVGMGMPMMQDQGMPMMQEQGMPMMQEMGSMPMMQDMGGAQLQTGPDGIEFMQAKTVYLNRDEQGCDDAQIITQHLAKQPAIIAQQLQAYPQQMPQQVQMQQIPQQVVQVQARPQPVQPQPQQCVPCQQPQPQPCVPCQQPQPQPCVPCQQPQPQPCVPCQQQQQPQSCIPCQPQSQPRPQSCVPCQQPKPCRVYQPVRCAEPLPRPQILPTIYRQLQRYANPCEDYSEQRQGYVDDIMHSARQRGGCPGRPNYDNLSHELWKDYFQDLKMQSLRERDYDYGFSEGFLNNRHQKGRNRKCIDVPLSNNNNSVRSRPKSRYESKSGQYHELPKKQNWPLDSML